MKKILILVMSLSACIASAEQFLTSGQSILVGNEKITCNPQDSTRCFCADRGCDTGYTSEGNVILNIVTTSGGSTRTQCVNYHSVSTCLQAMAACN